MTKFSTRSTVWICIIAIVVVAIAILTFRNYPTPQPHESVLIAYQTNIGKQEKAVELLRQSIRNASHADTIREEFFTARLLYKENEYLIEQYYPVTAKLLNMPPIDEVEDDDPAQNIVPPTGFQVLEEILFSDYTIAHQPQALREAENIALEINKLKARSGTLVLTDALIFDAIRKQLVRLIALGITGFDSPVAFHSIPEAGHVMQAMQQTITHYKKNVPTSHQKLYNEIDTAFSQAIRYLEKHTDFEAFDRMAFIREFANPLSAKLLTLQNAMSIPLLTGLRPLSPEASHVFSTNAFNVANFATTEFLPQTPAKVALGKVLFFDPILSGNNLRSCASCHMPSKAFTDGRAKAAAFAPEMKIERNTPSLLNTALQQSLFYDLRVTFLEDQISEVMQSHAEMNGNLKKTAETIALSEEYRDLFQQAFPQHSQTISERNINIAIAAYLRSLQSLDSRFDRHMRSDTVVLSGEEIHGFNLFAGKAKCATCHFIPLFNGTVPPDFEKMESEIIGVPQLPTIRSSVLDPDLGKYALHKKNLHRHAFKITTVRNVTHTAPYMHNGVYNTLEEVVDFYDRGGGKGIGIDLPNQTLPEEKLNLTAQEKKAIIAFLHSLSDTKASLALTSRLPSFPQAMKLNGRKNGGVY